MSTEKKLTPLHEAMNLVNGMAKTGKSSEVFEAMNGLHKALETLLPKEKEFAKEMWTDGWSKGFQDGENRDCEDDIVSKPNFTELYKQYEQS